MLHALLLVTAVTAASADTTHLVLVATTDVHGHATAWDYVSDRPFPGGVVRAAWVIDSLRARYPGRVVVVDAGDLLQGDPFADYYARVAPRDPHPVVEALNLAGYDVATPGNHDLDYGLATFDRAVAAATFRYVSGNILRLPGDRPAFPPYVVLTRGGVRVGVAGFTTPGVMVWSRKAVRGRLRVAPIEEGAARVLADLRRESDLAIVLIHSGMGGPSSYDTTGVGAEHRAAALAALPARPDLVVVGHSHREMVDSVVGGVHFVQPRPFAQSLAVVHLSLARPRPGGRWRIVRIEPQAVSLAAVPPAPRVAARLEGEGAAVREWADQSLGEARGAMPAALARAEPTPILNFIHAVQRRRSGAELSAASAFDLGAGFPDGDIRIRHVFALYPYENTLRAVRVSGAQLKDYLEQSARYYTTDSLGRVGPDPAIPGYNFDVVSGARYEIDLRLPAGSRIRNLTVRGRPVAPADSYTLALNSYRQSGGGGFAALAGAPVVYDRDENIRDLLIAEIRARRVLDPPDYADSNWRIVPDEAALAVRRFFGAPPPPVRRPAEATLLRILALGEFRGAVDPRAAALKAQADRAERDCGCPTLRLAPGDLLQGAPAGDLLAGRGAVEALNRLGLSATAIGPRDFIWSVDTLRQRMAQSRFPWLAANLFDSAAGRRPDWAAPYAVVTAGSLRVALVGYLPPGAAAWLRAAGVSGVGLRAGPGAVREALGAAAAERPGLTVLLTAAELACDAAGCRGEPVELAGALQDAPLDLIVAGGRGSGTARVGRITVVQARPAAAELAVVDLVRTVVDARELRARLEPVDPAGAAADSGMAALVARAEAEADSLARRVVARIKLPLGRSDEGESPLGDLVADAQRNVLRGDASLVPTGALEGDLPAGPVTYRDLLRLHRPPAFLVTFTLRGSSLRQVLERALAGGLPSAHVSGLVVHYDPRAAPGRRVKRVELADGRSLKDDGSYTLVTSERVAADPAYPMLAAAPATLSATTDVDALAIYLRRLTQPVPPPDRIRFQATR